jgi:hypothetical protein
MMRGMGQCMIVLAIANKLNMGSLEDDSGGMLERLGFVSHRGRWTGPRGDVVFERWSVCVFVCVYNSAR